MKAVLFKVYWGWNRNKTAHSFGSSEILLGKCVHYVSTPYACQAFLCSTYSVYSDRIVFSKNKLEVDKSRLTLVP